MLWILLLRRTGCLPFLPAERNRSTRQPLSLLLEFVGGVVAVQVPLAPTHRLLAERLAVPEEHRRAPEGILSDGRALWPYHVCFVCTEEIEPLPKVNGEDGDLAFVGVDLGIESLAVLSTGEKVGNPRWFANEYKRLRREQQKLSRKEKGSNNWERQRQRVAKVHQRIQDRRKDFVEKLTTRLARNFDVIVVENLSVKNMQQNGRLARHITQAGWNQIVRRLRDKCEWYGRTLTVADKWFPSTKRCSACGHIGESKPLDVREWTCSECGAHHDRDVNAAKNLSRVGQTRIQAPGDVGKPDAFEIVGSGR